MKTKLIKTIDELSDVVNKLIPNDIKYNLCFKHNNRQTFIIFVYTNKKTHKVSFKYLTEYTIEMIINKILHMIKRDTDI